MNSFFLFLWHSNSKSYSYIYSSDISNFWVVTGNHISEKVYILQMNLIPFDRRILLKFQRRKFLIMPYFAMTMKIKGNLRLICELFLPKPIFTHGQLYIVISIVKSKKELKILILDKNENLCITTRNIVYQEVFQKI